MHGSTEAGVDVAPTPGRSPRAARRLRGLVGTGCLATLGAVVTTTLLAAAAAAAGVDFEVPAGGETIPVPGIAVVTGVVIAAALQRWSAHPAERFRWVALSLTAVSLVPPILAGADTATTITLIGLHLAAASVMIPALVRALAQARGVLSAAKEPHPPRVAVRPAEVG